MLSIPPQLKPALDGDGGFVWRTDLLATKPYWEGIHFYCAYDLSSLCACMTHRRAYNVYGLARTYTDIHDNSLSLVPRPLRQIPRNPLRTPARPRRHRPSRPHAHHCPDPRPFPDAHCPARRVRPCGPGGCGRGGWRCACGLLVAEFGAWVTGVCEEEVEEEVK